MGRKSISKKTRFEVFKRDSFTCVYCGNTPPAVVLELDHIIPVSKNGKNDIDNYATSCFECNRGKGARELTELPKTVQEKHKDGLEREEQLKAFKKFITVVKRRKTQDINKISSIFSDEFPERELTDRFKRTSVGMFLEKLPFHEVEEAMYLSCDRIDNPPDAAKYFCGVCWRKVKDA